MQRAFDPIDMTPDSLAHFQLAASHARSLTRLTHGCCLGALVLMVVTFYLQQNTTQTFWLLLLCNNAATLLIVAGAANAARYVDIWRAQTLEQTRPAGKDSPQEPVTEPNTRLYRFCMRWRMLVVVQDSTAGMLWMVCSALIALFLLWTGWGLQVNATPFTSLNSILAGLLLLCAFGFLVIERHFAAEMPSRWPQAAKISSLLRMVIAVQLFSLPAILFGNPQTQWPLQLMVLTGALPAAIAVELFVRSALSTFLPSSNHEEPRFFARSLIAEQIRWPPRLLNSVQDEIQQRFGIDLRQVWAFTFIRRAFLPILALMVLAGWLLSGVHQVPLDNRGIYERFGKPITVLRPGLHAGLPWPFGRVITTENGIVHEIATSGDLSTSEAPSAADGPAPDSANRLWDVSHRSDKSLVIASTNAGKQSFQVVNMDIRFIYRIGLSDSDAMNAIYNSADVPALIRSITSRVLVHDFAARTLDSVLSDQLGRLAEDISQAVQQDLDNLKSGVQILSTVVDAIHPPAGAAYAYHAVQAAQITALALVSHERGLAAEHTSEARLAARQKLDKADAGARENLSIAHVAEKRFNAEREAWLRGGSAFLFERYLAQFSLGLSDANALVIDHRLRANDAPTIDLRGYLSAPVVTVPLPPPAT